MFGQVNVGGTEEYFHGVVPYWWCPQSMWIFACCANSTTKPIISYNKCHENRTKTKAAHPLAGIAFSITLIHP
jgi:hypothetical protein